MTSRPRGPCTTTGDIVSQRKESCFHVFGLITQHAISDTWYKVHDTHSGSLSRQSNFTHHLVLQSIPSLNPQHNRETQANRPHQAPDIRQRAVFSQVDVGKVVGSPAEHVSKRQSVEPAVVKTSLIRGHDSRGEETQRLVGVGLGCLSAVDTPLYLEVRVSKCLLG